MKNPTGYKLIWLTQKLLEANPGKYFFPVQVATALEISWVEADLALRMCVEYGRVFRRSDGRYLLRSDARLNVSDSFKVWLATDEGQRAGNPETGPLQRPFPENRLWSAFVAGHAEGART